MKLIFVCCYRKPSKNLHKFNHKNDDHQHSSPLSPDLDHRRPQPLPNGLGRKPPSSRSPSPPPSKYGSSFLAKDRRSDLVCGLRKPVPKWSGRLRRWNLGPGRHGLQPQHRWQRRYPQSQGWKSSVQAATSWKICGKFIKLVSFLTVLNICFWRAPFGYRFSNIRNGI